MGLGAPVVATGTKPALIYWDINVVSPSRPVLACNSLSSTRSVVHGCKGLVELKQARGERDGDNHPSAACKLGVANVLLRGRRTSALT